MSSRVNKKIEKLNKFMKESKKHIYEWTFFSKCALIADYKYLDIYKDIELCVYEEFMQKCEIHNLGSRAMGIAEEGNSDLDIFIDIGCKNYYKTRDYKMDLRAINKLKDSLGKRKEWDVKQLYILVPSFKAIHRPTGIKCDISVTNGMAVENSKLFGHLFSIQPDAISFYHFIKRWLRIFDVQKIRGFPLTLIVVLFLQQHRLMPTIQKVQEGLPKVIIDGFEVQFDSERTIDDYRIREMKDYRQWLKPFFKFYSLDIYKKYILCTYYGELFKKENYPIEINCTFPMTIAAPLLRHSNCAKSVTNLDIASFIDACRFSLEYFDEFAHRKELHKCYDFDLFAATY